MDEEPLPSSLIREMADVARTAGGSGAPVVLADRADGVVVRVGSVVAKAHPDSTSVPVLDRLVRTAAGLAPYATPLRVPDGGYVTTVEGRALTLWPYGEPVSPTEPERAPWVPAARLLAALHTTPVSSLELPPHGAPGRVRRALARLEAAAGVPAADRAVVIAAWELLAPRMADAPPGPGSVTHGDWHLGQLIETPAGWRLIDVDDLGLGDPAWDLARPASWFAIGLLEEADFGAFLGAYLEAGGTAVPAADPWSALDLPARALTVQAAAIALAKAAAEERGLDEVEEALLEACRRMPPVAMLT